MSPIAFVNYEASASRFYQETSTVSIISEQPSYHQNRKWLHILYVSSFQMTLVNVNGILTLTVVLVKWEEFIENLAKWGITKR